MKLQWKEWWGGKNDSDMWTREIRDNYRAWRQGGKKWLFICVCSAFMVEIAGHAGHTRKLRISLPPIPRRRALAAIPTRGGRAPTQKAGLSDENFMLDLGPSSFSGVNRGNRRPLVVL
jgi:hypothetical protein